MKRKITLLSMLLIAALSFAKDIKTVIVTTTPQMHCEDCENKIKGNMRFEKGIKRIETNIGEQTVTLTYDANKTTVDKLLKGFEKFGYKARMLKDGEKAVKAADGSCKNMQ